MPIQGRMLFPHRRRKRKSRRVAPNQPRPPPKPDPSIPGRAKTAPRSQSMSEYTEHLLSEPRKDTERFRIVWLVTVPLVAILFQVYVPRFVSFLSYLELPLLITVHFAL